jgi:hypothetical protein
MSTTNACLLAHQRLKGARGIKQKNARQKYAGQKNERKLWLSSFFCPAYFCFPVQVLPRNTIPDKPPDVRFTGIISMNT